MGNRGLYLIRDNRGIMDKTFSLLQQVWDKRIEKRDHDSYKPDIYKGYNNGKRRSCPEKLPHQPVGHMITQLHHFSTDGFCHIEKKIGKQEGDEKYGEKRLQKIDPNKKERYGEKFLKEIPVKNELQEKRKTHGRIIDEEL